MLTNPFVTAELANRTWALALEAGTVIWLRSWLMLSGGAPALKEGRLMVDEKVATALTLWPALLSGGMAQSPDALGKRALVHYARPVRANRRRLTRR